MDQQKNDTKRPEGGQDNKSAEAELKYKTSIISKSSWWAKEDTRDPKEGRDEEPKNNTKTKQRLQIQNQIETQGDVAGAKWQSTGGYHRLGREQGNTTNKKQRL